MKSLLKHKWKIFHLLLLITFIWLSICNSEKIKATEIEPIFSILQNTSGMIFTIMGIWIAYIYPNAILRITQPSKIEALFSGDDEKRVKLLVKIVILSAVIISCVLIMSVSKPFIIHSNFLLNHIHLVKSTGLFVTLLLSYGQVFCLYVVIVSCINFITDLRNKKTIKELDERL